MESHSIPDEIQDELAAARAALARDSQAAAADAHTLVDWQYHFRSHPWLWCTAAAAVGFLLVPSRQSTRAGAYRQPGSVNGNRQSPAPMCAAANLLGIGATLLAKESLRFVSRRSLDWLELRTAPERTRPRPTPKTGKGTP